MSITPKQRLTRSNSLNQQNNEISKLMDFTKELKAIVLSVKSEIQDLNNSVKNLNTRILSPVSYTHLTLPTILLV